MSKYTVEEAMAKTKTNSPREALTELKKVSMRYAYTPHVGAKQKAKLAKQLAKVNKG